MHKRHLKIIEKLSENEKIDVSVLAECMNVSQVTIRKDLAVLEQQGLLKRSHGSAILASSDDINYRMAYSYEVKKRIAKIAAQDIRNGDTVMIESGSTCALLATELATNFRDITIVTNSAFIAEYIRFLSGARVVLLGGDYDPAARVMVGPLVKICAREYHVEKYFVGVDGFSSDYGFHNLNIMRAETIRIMAKSAEQTIVLTDSSKFAKRSVNKQLALSEVSEVITDDGIDKDTYDFLTNKGIVVKTVNQ